MKACKDGDVELVSDSLKGRKTATRKVTLLRWEGSWYETQFEEAMVSQDPIVYHDGYNLVGKAKALAKFASPFKPDTYRRIREILFPHGEVKWMTPKNLATSVFRGFHSDEYMEGLKRGKLGQIVGSHKIFDEMLANYRHEDILPCLELAASGTILAAGLALARGWAINIGGGYHGCSKKDGGAGGSNSVYADVTMAVELAMEKGSAREVLVIDGSARRAVGIEKDFGGVKGVTVLDFFNPKTDNSNMPVNAFPNVHSFHYNDARNSDQANLSLIKNKVHEVLQRTRPDLIIYISGTDCMDKDNFGLMKCERTFVNLRDSSVFKAAFEHGCCIAMLCGPIWGKKAANFLAESIRQLMEQYKMSSGLFQTVNAVDMMLKLHFGREIEPTPSDIPGWDIDASGGIFGHYVAHDGSVAFYRDGAEYFDALADEIERATHFIYIHGWDFDPNLRLRRLDASERSIGEMLKDKAQTKNCRICICLWSDVPFEHFAQTQDIAAVKGFFAGSNVQVGLVPNTSTTSHHQKGVICGSKASVVSFVGGIDIARGRYDNGEHVLFPRSIDRSLWRNDWYSPETQMDENSHRLPWHDIHVRVTGAAANEIRKNFVERWNYFVRSDASKEEKKELKPVPEENLYHHGSMAPLDREWKVQLLRSMPATVLGGQTREASILHAVVRSIQRAKSSIYLENQYFISSSQYWAGKDESNKATNQIAFEIVRKISQSIEMNKRFYCMIIVPLYPDGGFDNDGSLFRRLVMKHQMDTFQMMFRAIAVMLAKYGEPGMVPEDYLGVFCLGKCEKNEKGVMRSQIYVHSKLFIVDDEYIVVGSANVNERSMSGLGDTELAVGCWQEGGKRQPLRQQLLEEHLGRHVCEKYSRIDDLTKFDLLNMPLNTIRKIRRIGEKNMQMFLRGKSNFSHLLHAPFYWDAVQSRLVPGTVVTSTKDASGSFKVFLADGTEAGGIGKVVDGVDKVFKLSY